MRILNAWTEDMPEYALPYLINGDSSGLTGEDIAAIDGWYYDIAARYNGDIIIETGEDSEPFFTWNPAFGLACTCYECKIVILSDEPEFPAYQYAYS